MRRLFACVSLLIVSACLVACGQPSTQISAIAFANVASPPTTVESVTDTDTFAAALRASGAVVTSEGAIDLAFLDGTGEALRVNDQPVQVYEYADDANAGVDASRFSSDGAWVNIDQGTMLVNWVSTPHLYRVSRLIAVYVGDHVPTLELLSDVLGEPFAGGANPYHVATIRTAD